MFDSLLHVLLPLRLYGKTNIKEKKNTQKNTDKRKTTTTTTLNLLLSLNVANLATDNFCYLWRKFDTKNTRQK